jgi:hypothetical protein
VGEGAVHRRRTPHRCRHLIAGDRPQRRCSRERPRLEDLHRGDPSSILPQHPLCILQVMNASLLAMFFAVAGAQLLRYVVLAGSLFMVSQRWSPAFIEARRIAKKPTSQQQAWREIRASLSSMVIFALVVLAVIGASQARAGPRAPARDLAAGGALGAAAAGASGHLLLLRAPDHASPKALQAHVPHPPPLATGTSGSSCCRRASGCTRCSRWCTGARDGWRDLLSRQRDDGAQ